MLCGVEGDCRAVQEREVAAADGQKQVSAARRSVSSSVLIRCQV